MKNDHDTITNRLASKLKTKHRHKGVDLLHRRRAMEVAVTRSDLYQSIGQLRRSRASKKYIVTTAALFPSAKKLLKDTGLGIMNTRGQIKKRSRKGRR